MEGGSGGEMSMRSLSHANERAHAFVVDQENSEQRQLTLRRLGEKNIHPAIEYLHTQHVPMIDVIRGLHVAATPNLRRSEQTDGKEIESGRFRTYDVEFGDKIGPAHQDVPRIMESFGKKLDEMIGQCQPDQAEALATWAYAINLATHPFEDANSRTSHGLAEYIRYSVAQKNNLPFVPREVPETDSPGKNEVLDKFGKLMFDMHLFPNPYNEMYGFGGPRLAIVLDEQTYFGEVRDFLLTRIGGADIQKISGDPVIQEAAAVMKDVNSRKSYRTHPLVASQASREFAARLRK